LAGAAFDGLTSEAYSNSEFDDLPFLEITMQRLNLDAAPADVKELVCAFAAQQDGVEVAMDGQVICKIIGVNQLTGADRTMPDESDLNPQEEAASWAELERDALSAERIDAIANFLQRTGQASA
jgi:hypothetical protein